MVEPLPPAQVGPSRAYATRIAIPPEVEKVARQRWVAGASVAEVARSLGLTHGAFRDAKLVGVLRDWPRRQGAGGGRPIGLRASVGRRSVVVERNPSTREIDIRTAAFRATWTLEEAASRRVRITDLPGQDENDFWNVEVI